MKRKEQNSMNLTKTIGDVARVISGYAFKSSVFQNSGIPVIKIRNVRLGRVDLSGSQFVDKQYLSLDEKYHVAAGDILVSLTGSHLNQPDSVVGRVARYPGTYQLALLNQRAGKVLVTRPDLCDSGYLYWVLFSVETRRQIASLAHGAANQANVSPSQIEGIKIRLPPIDVQRKISSILSAYDELIENNTRRINILEEMAQLLYHEWFVRFRFPVKRSFKLVDSPIGKIPTGWKAVRLREVCSYLGRGISPKYDDDSDAIVINQKCIRDQRLDLQMSRRHLSRVPTEKSVQFGDVVINSTGVGTLGRVAQVYEILANCTVDSHVTIVRPNERVTIDYLGMALLNLQSHFDTLGVGSTGQTELGRENLAKTAVLLPRKSLQERFSELVSPMRRNVGLLFHKNDTLRHTRDLLLPRLVAGQTDAQFLT